YQKDLIENLGYSNKTLIEHLRALVDLGILCECMEKKDMHGRTVWLKAYTLTDLGRWFALLLIEEESLPRENKIEIACNVFRSYVKWVRKLAESLGIDKNKLFRIFEEEMK
ncbi:hypothetical protein KEJ31_06005, partial [Candidatus Bathyarchaeota archaeon]|nr:hypothetical protein [Candidatus Bathyarchaeota archaeon]